jgi:uncharacterized membrane protein YraQ (UPF0718 family)
MREVFASLVYILRESSPYLILGFALAGVFHVLLQRYPRITAALSGPGKRPIFLAALIGAPMPLCSCSVVPAALALRRQGASKAATASFLVSVPETDIVSVLVTLALIGPFMAIYRPIAAVASALAVGLAVRLIEQRERARAPVQAGVPGAARAVMDSCCCECEPAPDMSRTSPTVSKPWWMRALHYGFVEIFDDIVPQLILGVVIAALIGVALPEMNPQLVRSHTFLSYLVMVAIGIPAYVCAAASTPIAAGLIAGGVSPGAALVFLLAGPATNAGSLVVLRSELGNRVLVTYVAMIAVTSIALGALLDAITGPAHVNAMAHVHEHGGNSITATVLMYVFLLWTILSFHRSRLVPRMRDGLSRRLTARPSMK